MTARTVRRLPGVRFEPRAPQLTEGLPRMDVAIFVGFAASGPLHLPVAVEDFAEFTAVFGDAAPLAWDAARGVQTTTLLAPAVREFFREGGRRCWVVRVAGDKAASNYFPLPNLACAEFDPQGKLHRVRPAFARARSEGSWSDGARVATALLSQTLRCTSISKTNDGLMIELKAPADVAEGDLLRLRFRDTSHTLFASVKRIVPDEEASPPSSASPGTVRVETARALWLEAANVAGSPPQTIPARVRLFTQLLDRESFSPPHDTDRDALPNFESEEVKAEIAWPNDKLPQFEIRFPDLAFADAPAPGSLLRVDWDDQHFWLAVRETGLGQDETASPPNSGLFVRVSGETLTVLKEAPPALPAPALVEKLSFELRARFCEGDRQRLSDLGLAPNHPRCWAALPDDRQFYQSPPSALASRRTEQSFESEIVTLWRTKDNRRFPLAGSGEANALFFPIGMTALAERELPPVQRMELRQEGGAMRPVPVAALSRDGLAKFDASLFLDRDLADTGVTSLMEQADFLRYFSHSPRPLKGIHAAFGFGETTLIEEATLIAAPDAAHRGWNAEKPDTPARELPSDSLPHPEWWRFLPCDEREKAAQNAAKDGQPFGMAQRGNFLDCSLRALEAPRLRVESQPDRGGSFTLAWDSVEPGGAFVLEEATDKTFQPSRVIYSGADRRLTLYGRSRGNWFYRVRVQKGGATSDWSLGNLVTVGAGTGYVVRGTNDFEPQTLLGVQRALLRMCAARGDLLAVLSLPEHYRDTAAIAHVHELKAPTAAPIEVGFVGSASGNPAIKLIQSLGKGEAKAFSYGALYHPWLIVRENAQARPAFPVSPEGVACGVMAARAVARGAWIAPANETLHGVVALVPSIAATSRLDLQEAQINLIRQEARGFLCLSADTLSEDEDLRPINVRRLLILLRRLALRQGAQYVFEPNDDSFRRLVERGFENLLGDLFERGAFAGKTPDTSFEVNADTPLNSRGQEQGRFIVELKVAPSLPLTFLTIRVIQSGERARVEER